ncbi:MAG TPA: T9SS type A sorting domain-containing protein, partial [Candidatus Kapabacteria bacterium]|nr:T9SS type A sorting domain-containing protein [Candidatus Kapabacteria bacterium]
FDQKIMCIASSSLFTNVIYFGLDWRHFPMADALIRAAMDYVQNNGGTIIPIELFSFDANAVGKRVELNWITASEVNSSRFDIEKAKVNEFGIGAFAKIDEVKAKGNSAVATEYGPVIDRSVSAGKSYAYRLKMIDQNGEFSYSNTRVVTIDGDGAFEVTSISPNPAKDFAYISFYSPVEGSAVVEIYNIAGSKVFAESFSSISAGENQLRLDLRNLTAGSYTIVVYAGNRSTTTTLKVVK